MGHVYALKIMQVMITVETTIGRDYQNSKVRVGRHAVNVSSGLSPVGGTNQS